MAYQDYKRLFSGARWDKLKAKGAKPQRLLWASTGTKNKDYSDVLYVEELIGPNTVNTVPPATLDAFRDHGTPRDSLEENIEDARRVLEELEKSGISLDAITTDLVKDGVKQFADAADKLYGAVAHKRAASLGGGIDKQQLALGDGIKKAVEKSTEDWRASAKIRRLWHKDKSVWSNDDENKWLGWLTSPAAADVADYEDFARRVKGQNFSDAVVLGMGGSSLGPEVLAETFPKKSGFPKLHVLDSTDPAQVRAMEKKVDLAKTLFIVSSKSGGTTEPNAMKDYFFDRVSKTIGADKAGHRFIAVTDPGSSLEKVATKQGFARIFYGDPIDRRTLLGAVAVRAGAGGCRRHRCQKPDQAHAGDGALLRRRRAAARKPRRTARACARPRRARRPRQGDDLLVEEDRRFRRLGRAIDRGVHRQGRQGPDPDRRRTARRSRGLRQRPLLHRYPDRRRRRRGA